MRGARDASPAGSSTARAPKRAATTGAAPSVSTSAWSLVTRIAPRPCRAEPTGRASIDTASAYPAAPTRSSVVGRAGARTEAEGAWWPTRRTAERRRCAPTRGAAGPRASDALQAPTTTAAPRRGARRSGAAGRERVPVQRGALAGATCGSDRGCERSWRVDGRPAALSVAFVGLEQGRAAEVVGEADGPVAPEGPVQLHDTLARLAPLDVDRRLVQHHQLGE